jgi:hypothetical protein
MLSARVISGLTGPHFSNISINFFLT